MPTTRDIAEIITTLRLKKMISIAEVVHINNQSEDWGHDEVWRQAVYNILINRTPGTPDVGFVAFKHSI